MAAAGAVLGRGLSGWNPSPGRSTRQRSTSCRAPLTGSIGRARLAWPVYATQKPAEMSRQTHNEYRDRFDR